MQPGSADVTMVLCGVRSIAEIDRQKPPVIASVGDFDAAFRALRAPHPALRRVPDYRRA
jgi:hypothetical protein